MIAITLDNIDSTLDHVDLNRPAFVRPAFNREPVTLSSDYSSVAAIYGLYCFDETSGTSTSQIVPVERMEIPLPKFRSLAKVQLRIGKVGRLSPPTI